MKAYSIGRDVGCDIVINDPTDVISRRHATLNVDSSGKMTIVDLSRNGTYVNGIRISQNVPVPVTRKDNISFAHVARFDWNLVPKTTSNLMRYSILGVIVVVAVVGVVFGLRRCDDKKTEPAPVVQPLDSAELARRQAERAAHMKDSITKAVNDSLSREKAKQDSIADEKRKADAKKKAKEEPKKTEKPAANDSTPKSKATGYK